MFVSRWIVRPFVLLAVGWAALGIAPLTPLQAASQTAKSGATSVPPSPSPQRAVLDRYCIGCHNQTRRSAGLALDDVDLTDVSAGAVVWEKVIRKLRAGAMPPPGSPRPDRATYDTLASWLENELDRTAQARPNPGRTETFHRLNRTEYHNVIRDLLALDVDVASLVPDDDGSYGFDNIAGVLKISPTLLDRYLTAARAIASTALGSSDVVPSAETLRVRSDFSQRSRDDGLPIGTRGGALFQHTFPLDAEYEFRIDVGGAAAPERHQLEVTIDGTLVNTFAVGRGPSSAQGAAPTPSRNGGLKFRVPVTAGPHEIAATFVMKTSATPDGLYKPSLRSEGAGLPTVDGLTVTGPYGAARTTETPSRRQIFVCHPTRATEESECATKILSSLARRAYRRPVAKSDVDPLLRFYESGRVDGDFEAGIESALRRLLVSPQFLFRVERDPSDGQQVYGLSDLELASRLSFFLWSSIPDDELLDTAARGRLKNPVVLARQVRRMIADPRTHALASNFAGQWLYLRNLPTVTPDAAMFPYFGENLRRDFQKETELFFESLLRENRSVIELLTADYTFVTERLAKHYGIPNVYGSRFRRVTLTDPSRRGLLGQGSFLTVTSHPDRTSVVGRGKWILENLLGSPPPPPPPNVPALPESTGSGRTLTLRERMAEHRANPVCASCHARMDPLGFALENFDATGRWRTQEGFRPIDASAALPDGTKFDGPAGLRAWLVSYREQIVTTVAEKLLTYGLGRGLEYYDAPALRQITRSAARDNYSFSSLIVAIVQSVPFEMRRRDVSPTAIAER